MLQDEMDAAYATCFCRTLMKHPLCCMANNVCEIVCEVWISDVGAVVHAVTFKLV